jgi:hypothetical protein
MPRFRTLSHEELQVLEPEFKQFLIVNQLYDKEWRELAAQQPQKAQEFIALFSDIVLEKAYQKAQSLVQIGHDFIALFLLQEAKWQFMHFQFQQELEPDAHHLTQFLPYLQQYISETKIQRGTKIAPENKVAAVHQLVSNGAQLLNTELTDQISVFFQDEA